MILSHTELEHIALAVTQDFAKYISNDSFETKRRIPRATPIDQFARDYLGLNVGFARLSPDESVCGLTCYADTEYTFEENGVVQTLPIRQNQVLLDTSFQVPGRKKQLHQKRRFTLAHECAHQLLFQMESDDVKQRHRGKYSPRTAYSLRALKTREDWNEWQANALGAAILMPQVEIELAMQLFPAKKFLINYEGCFTYPDRMILSHLCQWLDVSKAAMIIRLRQLGYMEDRPYSEYNDPTEVWP